jgi:hypothetical protein
LAEHHRLDLDQLIAGRTADGEYLADGDHGC